ncbi:hypothetical protein LEL_06352 [Akanthomyces lecanii RCEF 1005]|uniref:Uncharacterized protein n=1 Tax=Akanthomyces lecanii RCEF 1005 TaxID=1081108 RepID=A0A162KLE3_CORDF|nr:hypothetical protein LEL_06352 [Akanthomyces lecanii RCEF 1005]
MAYYSQPRHPDAYSEEPSHCEPEGSLWVGNAPSPQPIDDCQSGHQDAFLEEPTQNEPEGSLWVSNPPSPQHTDEDGGSIDGDEESSDDDEESSDKDEKSTIDRGNIVEQESASPSLVLKRLPPFRSFPMLRRSPTLKPLPYSELFASPETESESEQLRPTMFDPRPMQDSAAAYPLGPDDYDADDQHCAADYLVDYDTEEGTSTAAAFAAHDPKPAAESGGESEEASHDHTSVSQVGALQQRAKLLSPVRIGCSRTALHCPSSAIEESCDDLPATAAAGKDAWTQTVAEEESSVRVEDTAAFAQQRIQEQEDAAVWMYAAAVLSFVAIFWIVLELALDG